MNGTTPTRSTMGEAEETDIHLEDDTSIISLAQIYLGESVSGILHLSSPQFKILHPHFGWT